MSTLLFRAHHVSLTVADIDRAIGFYRSFGFEVAHEYLSTDGRRRMAHLRLGNFMLELFQFPLDQPEESASNRDIHPLGIRHFALAVDSVADAYSQVVELGYVCDGIGTGLSGLCYFFVRDPDGIWFEVIEDKRALESNLRINQALSAASEQ